MAGPASRENGKKGGRPRKTGLPPAAGDAPPLEAPLEAPQPTDPPVDAPFMLTTNEFGLSRREEVFVAAYLVNPSAAAAYREAHPRCSEATSQTNGPGVLRKTHIQAALAAGRRAQWLRLQMDGDEALARIANIARGDIGEVLPENDRLRLLPEEVRRRIKSVRETKYGREIVLYDALHATEVIAKATGKLKDIVRVENLEDIMARANALAAAGAGGAPA